ncbi:MAG: hypothetical protein Q9O74_08095 [Planctomycetota bacterium]|nr:hypothetical protein [Planctomycetota bacterium]
MNKLPLAVGVVLLHAAAFAAGAAAQSQDQSENRAERAVDRQPELPSTLAGPSVDPTEPNTLVVYEYNGQLQELGLPPAEAALDLLELDPETGEAVATVIAERALLAEQLITDNFDLFSQSETIEAGGTGLEKGWFFLRVLRVLHPLIERGSLEDEIRPLLPEMTARDFDALLEEYWQAIGQARVDDAKAKGHRVRLRKAVREARRDQLGKEIEMAAERAVESERFAVQYLTKGIELNEFQLHNIQTLINDHMGRTMGEASENDTALLFLGVLAYLDETQRAQMIERIKGVQ